MASPSTSGNRGLSVIEIVLVVAITVLLLAAGLPASWTFYQRNELRAERHNLENLLRMTRTFSMANRNQAAHGVYIDSQNFVVYEGANYAARNAVMDKIFPRSRIVSISGGTEVLFGQLSGTSTAATLTLSITGQSENVTINAEGKIE